MKTLYFRVTVLVTIIFTVTHGSSFYENPSANDGPFYFHRIARAKPSKKQNECKEPQGPAIQKVETYYQQDSKIIEIFKEDSNPRHIRGTTNKEKQDVKYMLKRWFNYESSDTNLCRNTEQSNGDFRLDRQGEFTTANYGIFMNYQVQVNGAKKYGPSTVAQVNIPKFIWNWNHDTKEWRLLLKHALKLSLQDARRVWVLYGVPDKDGNLECLIRSSNSRKN